MDKVLGKVWVKGSDLLTFNVDQLVKHCHSLRGKSNLRTVLSISARIYDVLGLVSPVVITCRILIQKIWRHKLDWDQPLPDDLNKEFWGWVSKLPKLSKVPRHYFGREVDPLEIQLILCSDASTKAYGANAYFRSVNRKVPSPSPSWPVGQEWLRSIRPLSREWSLWRQNFQSCWAFQSSKL